ncbi:MAG TPA: hypothetical protein VFH08_15645, partial [Chitinophagaceae bacterium]|nr:hypothetical protein [Chitinophagaceae bacterium]
MKSKYAFLIFILLNFSVRSQPSDPNQTSNRVLIINAYDVQAYDFRKNKKELFAKLADSLKSFLAHEIRRDKRTEPVIIDSLFPSILDSTAVIDSLKNAYQANTVIIIKKLDVFFEQTGVEVTKERDGSKSREASYDICSEVDYILYESNNEPRHSLARTCEGFGTRNVVSGLFAAGPDIVANRKHAYVMIGKNAKKLIRSPDKPLFSRSSDIREQDFFAYLQSSDSNQTPGRLLIINAFDAQATDYRKNKKELFAKLADSLKSYLAHEVRKYKNKEPVIIDGLFPSISDSPGLIDSLKNVYQAKAAVIIKNLNAFFEESEVEVTRERDDSNSGETAYDICSGIDYVLYEPNNEPRHFASKTCEPFTTRAAVGGLIATGPDIVAKSKHAFTIVGKNAEKL